MFLPHHDPVGDQPEPPLVEVRAPASLETKAVSPR
jgi:hypothetical protein